MGELCVASLWEMESFKAARLPRVAPISPILSTQDNGDSVMYFNLEEVDGRVHLCSLNMRTKTLLPSSFLLDTPRPSIVGSDCFKRLKDQYPLCPVATSDAKQFPVPPQRAREEDSGLLLPVLSPRTPTLPSTPSKC